MLASSDRSRHHPPWVVQEIPMTIHGTRT